MINSDYQATIDWLFQQFPSYQLIGSKAYKPTLENTQKLLSKFGNPHEDLTFIHVAGSNGKGSVCSIIASTLTEFGEKVGLFTSPHIKDFSERIRVNGVPISKSNIVSFVNKLKSFDLDFEPSFFEITFVLALIHFKETGCSICVIETGLGGRLDATNVIVPIISVITSISLEHTHILGDTLEQIAAEKGGIIKSNTPFLLGKMTTECNQVLTEIGRQHNAEIISRDADIPDSIAQKLIAQYQVENVETAISALHAIRPEISDKTIINGYENLYLNTGFHGRLEVISTNPLIIYDVSHNADGIKATLEAVNSLNKGQLHIIYGTSSDKDLEEIKRVLPDNASYYFTEFGSERSAKTHDLKAFFDGSHLESICYFNTPSDALNKAKKNASEIDTILVMGSFFLVEHFF